ncbi:hypothetical protein JTB14_036310 [Gonioctena quinquepunctata]|nr:hypothetical protein JTB14_036310 [Gonioctena quinquepunctata]
MRGRTKKWTIRAIYHFYDFAVAACWLEYRQNASKEGLKRKDTLDYLDFKLSVAQYLILTEKPSEQSEGNSEQSDCEEEETPPLKQRKVQPVPDRRVRTVGNIHPPVFTKQEQKTKCRFPKCGKVVKIPHKTGNDSPQKGVVQWSVTKWISSKRRGNTEKTEVFSKWLNWIFCC